jgi:hypothetical protein
MFNPPKPHANKDNLEFNLSNIRSISKALQGRIHVESRPNSVKFIFVIKVEVPPSAMLFWNPDKEIKPDEVTDPQYVQVDERRFDPEF